LALITKSRADRSSVIPQCWNKSWGTEIAKSDIVSMPIFLSLLVKDGCKSRPSRLEMAAFWDIVQYHILFSELIIKEATPYRGEGYSMYDIVPHYKW
jgi:hypothetical protein